MSLVVNNSSNIVMYHGVDLDGKMGAAIAYKALGKNAYYIGQNYEKVTAKDILDAYPNMDTLYLIDYSLPPDIILALLKKQKKVIFIDHHITAIEAINLASKNWSQNELERFINFSHSDKGVSGATLAWKYFFYTDRKSNYSSEEAKEQMKASSGMPFAVILTGIYDTWDTDSNLWVDAVNLNNFIYYRDFTFPWSNIWPNLFTEKYIYTYLNEGNLISKTLKVKNYRDSKSWGGILEWEGIKFYAINATGNSNTVEDVMDPDAGYQAILYFKFSPREGAWKVSLYHSNKLSSKPDLSKIALKYGGGGHMGACGFSCKELPFSFSDIKPLNRKGRGGLNGKS